MKKNYLFLIMIFLISSSCGLLDSIEDIIPVMEAKFDGVSSKTNLVVGSVADSGNVVIGTFLKKGGVLTIVTSKEPGYYSIDTTNMEAAVLYYEEANDILYAAYSGEVEFDYLDKEKNRIAGKFNFDAIGSDGTYLKVNNGKFDDVLLEN